MSSPVRGCVGMADLSAPCTQAEIAGVMGVTQQNVSALMLDGKLPSVGTLGEIMHAYCHRLREQAAGRVGTELGDLDLTQERAALSREQRLGIELKNATLRSAYAPVKLLTEALATVSQSIARRFDLLPAMLETACPDLPGAARSQVLVALNSARDEWIRATSALATSTGDRDRADDAADVEETGE